MVIKQLLKIALAILIVIIAWKIVKGLLGLAVGILIAGIIIYGGAKMIGGPRND